MKKILYFSIFLLFSILLVGCKKETNMRSSYDVSYTLPKAYVSNNHQKNIQTVIKDINEAKISDEFISVDYQANGYFIVAKLIDSEVKYGVYDVNKDELVVPLNYSDIFFRQVNYYNKTKNKNIFKFHVELEDFNNRTAIYSLSENKYLATLDLYDTLDLSVSFIDNETTEIITYKKVDLELVKEVNKISFNKDDVISREKTTLNVLNNNKMYLNNLPLLENYSYTFENDVITGYKNEKLVFKVKLPSSTTLYTNVFSKHMIVQNNTELPFDAKKYSYYDSDSGKKYLLETSKVDLTTGNVLNIRNFEYVVSNGQIKYGDKEKPDYLAITARKISNKILLDERLLLMDDRLNILTDLTGINADTNFRKISDDLYLTNTKLVVDKTFKVILDLRNYDFVSPIDNVGLLNVRKDFKNGLLNLKGEIVVDLEYDLNFNFINDFSYNTKNLKKYLIKKDGTVTNFDDSFNQIRQGLLSKVEGANTKYYNYNNKELFNIDYNHTISQTINIGDLNNNNSYSKVSLVIKDNTTNKYKIYTIF